MMEKEENRNISLLNAFIKNLYTRFTMYCIYLLFLSNLSRLYCKKHRTLHKGHYYAQHIVGPRGSRYQAKHLKMELQQRNHH